VSFTVTREDTRSYSVEYSAELDVLTGEFEIEKEPVTAPWTMILGIIAGVVVIGLAIYVFARRRQATARIS
jgi:LPXTG-motif cell wall-anchored protein